MFNLGHFEDGETLPMVEANKKTTFYILEEQVLPLTFN